MEQFAIAITGGVAIWLTQQGNSNIKKYACLFGMAGQPFWIYSAYNADQLGILALSIFTTYSWCVGIKNNWIIPKLRNNNG